MDAPPRRSARTTRRPGPHVAVLAGGLLLAAVLILTEVRHLYFFGDDWAFLVKRDLSGDGLLEPHNEHWSSLPLLVYRAMIHVVGIDHFLLWAAMPVALHLVVCSLLFLLLRRHGVGPWISVLTTLILAFACGNLGEDLLWPFQIGFLGSAALGLMALLAHDLLGSTRVGLALMWIATVLSLTASGMAVPMAVWLGALVLMTRGLVPALVTVVPPAIVYVTWYLGYGRHAVSTAPDTTVDLVLDFAWTGLGSLWQLVTRVPSGGGIIFLVLLGVVLLGPVPARVRALALSGLLAAIATYLFIGTSRSGFGVIAATSSRYAYFGVLMSLPAFAVVATWISERMAERPVERRVAWGVVTVLIATSGWAQLHAFRVGRETLEPGMRQRVLAAAELVRDDARFLEVAVEPSFSPDVTVETLAKPTVQDALPDVPTTPRGRLDAAVSLQATAGPVPPGLPAVDRLLRSGIETEQLSADGCRQFRAEPGAYFELPPTRAGSQVVIVSPQSVLRVQMIGRYGESYVRQIGVVPDERTFVATSSSEATLRIHVDAGRIEVCES